MVNFVEMGIMLTEKRHTLGYAQDMVAEIVGVTGKTIRNIEYGCTAAELATILKLWDFYELPHDMLFEFYIRSDEMENAIYVYREKISKSKERITVVT